MDILLWFLFICKFVSLFTYTSASSGFLIAAPRVLLAGSTEKICISFHNHATSTPVFVSLLHITSEEIISSKQVVLEGNSSCLSIDVPYTSEIEGRLKIQLTDDVSNNIVVASEKKVLFAHDPLVTIISTDKPFYRPGEIIRFRVLSLTHHLKVSKHKFSRLWIECPNGITVAQWLAEELNPKHGLLQLEFPLSEESLTGKWKIKAEFDKNYPIEETEFIVKDYKLPRFIVTIEEPKEILADNEIITYKICAKYSYGAVVKGDVRTEFTIKSQFDSNQLPKIVSTMKLNNWTGCVTANISGDELALRDLNIQPETIELLAVVTETGSYLSEEVSKTWEILHTAVKLQFHCSQYFKPGLPYKGKLQVLSSGGDFITAADLPIQICLKEENSVLETSVMATLTESPQLTCWNYSTDFNSQIQFTLPPLLNSSKALTVTAVSLSHRNKFYSGENRWRLLMIQPKTIQALRPWFSPSGSYMEVSTVIPVACNINYLFHVKYTVADFNQPTPLFHYMIESRGDLLKIGSIQPLNEKQLLYKMTIGFPPARSFTFPIEITPDMSPESRLIVYYSRSDGEIVAASMFVMVDHCFPNKVSLRWSAQQVAPGEEVTLTVRTHPHSLCATNVLDSRTISNDFDPYSIWSKLARYKIDPNTDASDYCENKESTQFTSVASPPDWDLRRKKRLSLPPKMYDYVDAKTAFDDFGVVIMTDMVLETRPCSNTTGAVSEDGLYTERKLRITDPMSLQLSNDLNVMSVNPDKKMGRSMIRDFFPESWLWKISNVGKSGEISLRHRAPHSIASWKASVLCLHNELGFGMNLAPLPLETFIPFYLELDVPNSFNRLEELNARVIIYNHLAHSLPVKITLNTTTDIDIIGSNEASICVEEFVSQSVTFTIRGVNLGKHSLVVTALVKPILSPCGPPVFSGVSDTLMKTVNIKSEGFPVSIFHSALLCNDERTEVPWNLSLPKTTIEGSARSWVSISADLLGPSLQGLENLVDMPTGCGEQNMIRLAPGIQLLRYIDAVNPPGTSHIRKKTINFIQKGYQRQLLYRHPDGSFSAFGPNAKGEEGSMWLTAFVLKSLGQARSYILIDEASLIQTLEWITSKQLENGCFPTFGRVFNKEMTGGVNAEDNDSTTVLTAFVMISLYQSGLALPASLATNVEFCLAAERTQTDAYSLSLITYAFSLLKSRQKAESSMQKLMDLSHSQGGLLWWTKPGSSGALNVEITSYAILSLMTLGGSNNTINALSANRWLNTQRNNIGGFHSTQDTVVALEALAEFAIKVQSDSVDTSLELNLKADNFNKIISIESQNTAAEQIVNIPVLPSVLYISSKGNGCAVVQATLKYNVNEELHPEGFNLLTRIEPLSRLGECYLHRMEICVSYTLPDSVSNMAVVIINFVTGYFPQRESLFQLTGIKRWEENADENKVTVYLEQVEATPFCFSFIIQRLQVIENPAFALVTVYDYYHPERTKSVNYTVLCNQPGVPDGEFSVDNLDNFNEVGFDLETPGGNEGPQPSYACPESSPNCTLPR